MRPVILALASLWLCSGCASTILRNRTNDQATTLPDLYHQQILDNLAMIHESPAKLPYFSNPVAARTGVHRTTTASYQLGWDFITTGATAFLGRYLVDKQFSQAQQSQLTIGEWLPRTVDNPDKLLLMQCAYHKAIGLHVPQEEVFLHDYYYKSDGKPLASQRYEQALRSGWFGVGARRDVPHCAIHVGHHGHTYVWVTPEHQEDLTWFTLAIMDIATIMPVPAATHSGSPPVFAPRERSATSYVIP